MILTVTTKQFTFNFSAAPPPQWAGKNSLANVALH